MHSWEDALEDPRVCGLSASVIGPLIENVTSSLHVATRDCVPGIPLESFRCGFASDTEAAEYCTSSSDDCCESYEELKENKAGNSPPPRANPPSLTTRRSGPPKTPVDRVIGMICGSYGLLRMFELLVPALWNKHARRKLGHSKNDKIFPRFALQPDAPGLDPMSTCSKTPLPTVRRTPVSRPPPALAVPSRAGSRESRLLQTQELQPPPVAVQSQCGPPLTL
ncbi:hypothetical protein HDU88_007971 [Geranomyces variabilis]|nr:hypothetical protein HDU88_007971 [Geranomyces variabilis]